MERTNQAALQEIRSDFAGFHRLMPHRVEDVLLVCSLYESFILEEDGLVADLISSEYLEMNLSHSPRVARVSTGHEALEVMRKQSFDLVITMTRLGDWNVCDFAAEVKAINADTAIVVLADEPRDLYRYADTPTRASVDQFFAWNGDAKILLAIIKYIEDRLNAAYDAQEGDVRVIILVEDSVRFYSAYLPLIYAEVMKLTQSLMTAGVNSVQRLLRMRARPKILHATTFEQAWNLFEQYSTNILGVITDIRFPRHGKLDSEAGLEFTRRLKGRQPHLPILLQSTNVEYREMAAELGAGFVDKNARTLLNDLRAFLSHNLGFGDFVFRIPDGTEVGRANDVETLADMIRIVPEESIAFHASSDHFSNWLMARTEFELAAKIKPQKVTDFETLSDMRAYLVQAIEDALRRSHTAGIVDFSRHRFSGHTHFTRMTGGAMGGKARGLAFVSTLLDRFNVTNRFEDVRVAVPRCTVIGTDSFDEFLDSNNLRDQLSHDLDDDSVCRMMLDARLPRSLQRDLSAFLNVVEYPLAIRSSGLLEDSHGQPFAGIYQTHMIPNNHRSRRVRLQELCNAIKLVYASTFFRGARRYMEATAHRLEEEKMGVIVQELVGRRHGDYFYPNFSGVARSYNYYPFGRVNPEDGVAAVALGLGKTVVEGEQMLMFSPAHPQILPQFATTKDALTNSQRQFYALDLNRVANGTRESISQRLVQLDLEVAERDGTLAPVGSVYSPENNMIYDGINRPGARLVTFAHVLKTEVFPLNDILRTLLDLGQEGMACPVEIEFAVDMLSDPMTFGVLQIRPIIADETTDVVNIADTDQDRAMCFSRQTLGNGVIHDVNDVIYVRPTAFDASKTRQIAEEIARMNLAMNQARRPYILIGPGRWGTSDPWLGIPVSWEQVSGARVIVETSLADYVITPSQGTHFFQNLTSFRVGYMTVNPTAGGGFVDWDWLNTCDVIDETQYVRHCRPTPSLRVELDGRTRLGVILKNGDPDRDERIPISQA
jgi:CheY-like chemotaxis protein